MINKTSNAKAFKDAFASTFTRGFKTFWIIFAIAFVFVFGAMGYQIWNYGLFGKYSTTIPNGSQHIGMSWRDQIPWVGYYNPSSNTCTWTPTAGPHTDDLVIKNCNWKAQ